MAENSREDRATLSFAEVRVLGVSALEEAARELGDAESIAAGGLWHLERAKAAALVAIAAALHGAR